MAKKTILIIGNELITNKALKDALEDAGFKIIDSKNAEDGLEKAKKTHPALIVLDLYLPKMDGMTMLKELRKNRWGKNVFVLILTTKKIDSDALDEAGRYPYVSSYNLKSENDVNDVVRMVKERMSWEKWKKA